MSAKGGPSRPRSALSNGSMRAAGSQATSKKRVAEPNPEPEEDEFQVNGEELDLAEDGSDDDDAADEEDGAESDEDGVFPELDSGSEEDEFDEEDVGHEGYEGEADSEDVVEEGESLDGESDDEGYNSSDIERMYGSSPSTSIALSPGSSTKDLPTDEKLSHMIAKSSVKPDESIGTDAYISRAKAGNSRIVPSKYVPGGVVREYEDVEAGYGSESSTEDNPNTIGNVPMEWYDDLPHIGYDVSGRKIFRPAKGDELDKFLANVEDPAAWTSAEDKLLQQQVQLTDKELDIIRRLERAENPDADFDPYQDTIEWFTGKGMERQVPLSAAPEPKRRFVPSKWEHKKVSLSLPWLPVSVLICLDHEDCQGHPGGPDHPEQTVGCETYRLLHLVGV